jgi:ATP-dependent DNA ligase
MREFRRKNLYWHISQNGESYTTEHGQIGTDNPQTFSDTPGPKGKEGTKAYVSAIDNCTFHMNREIRKKQEHGYIEFINGKPATEEVTEIDFNKYLPKNFCSYKPQCSIEDKAHQKIYSAGHAQYSRKYDGMNHIVAKHPWGWEIYTRRMDLATERFPNHILKLNELDADVGTVFSGEMVCHTPDGRDDFKAISRICRSDPEDARKLIIDNECPEPTYRVFDLIYYNGNPLSNKSFAERQALWYGMLNKVGLNTLVNKVDIFDLAPVGWEEFAKTSGWEGFVLVDTTSVPGEKLFSFDGEAKRPKGHYKLKPVYEEDVVIYAGVTGSGKRLGCIGSVLVKQRHPETKEWIRCGKVGSGFTDEDIVIIGNLLSKANLPIYDKEKDDNKELDDNGIVAMIECGERQPGSQKFRFPVFIRTRTDKLPEECFIQRLAPEEE